MKVGDQYKFLGIARLIKNKRCEGEAEYAIIISDPWQNKSLGITLSEQCIELAKKEGLQDHSGGNDSGKLCHDPDFQALRFPPRRQR